jgi:putative hydrolase of the HAD superfamily
LRHELWIDADDTLWENNVFFERAFHRFADHLAHPSLTHAEVRDYLDGIEHVNNRIHGYGSARFARNLLECFAQLSESPLSPRDEGFILGIGDELSNHPMELIEGVEETLEYLASRHELLLCTKGDPGEQQAKIDRSGLAPHFRHVRIVREKDTHCYRGLIQDRGVTHGRCWMVGNSPKSDINPALEAGLGAVYIPHPHTWHLEHQDVPREHERLLVVSAFRDLRNHF